MNSNGKINQGFINDDEKNELKSEKNLDPILNDNKNFVYKEGGWGWIVVVASSYCFGILYGMVGNYALIYNKFEIVYKTTPNHVLYAGK